MIEFDLSEIRQLIVSLESGGWKGKFGIGIVQWTDDRAKTLMSYYEKTVGSSGKLTTTQIELAENEFIVYELLGGYYNTYSKWADKYSTRADAAYCAGVLLTQQYIKPSGTNYATTGSDMKTEYQIDKERGTIAQKFYGIMLGQ